MAAGDILAVRIASTARDNGWVAEIDISSPAGSPTTGGTYALGLAAANNDPATAKIVLTVTSPGYDSAGSLTTIQRTVYGTKAVRKASPNQATSDEALVSTTLTVRVALSEFIYTGDTVTAVISSGFYTQGVASAAFSGSVTNNSTLAHPKVVGRWAWVGYESFQSSIPVEACIFHRSGTNGKPVAAVVFTLTDGTTTRTITTSTVVKTVRSNDQGRGVILVYTASFNASDFTQGAVLTANFAAYPIVGGSGAVLDTSTGTAPPSPAIGPLKLLCDKNGTYGGGCAVVDATNGHASAASTWVTATQATAESAYASSTANSYTTIGFAVQAIKTYNNANLSRNNPGGGIILLTGNHSWPGTSPATTQGAQDVWLTITRLSTKPRASAVINAGTSATLNTDKIRLYDITISGNVAGGFIYASGNTDSLWMDYNTVNITGGAGFYQWKIAYATRNTVLAAPSGFNEYSTDPTPFALVRGNANLSGAPMSARDYTHIGNFNFSRWILNVGNNLASFPVLNDGGVCAYNICFDLTSGNDFNAGGYTAGETYSIGYAFVQNVIEKNTGVGTDPLVQICADGRTATSNNIIFWHNTIAGERLNIGYNDTGTVAVLATNYSLVGNALIEHNIKDDVFIDPTNGAQAGRTGNWSVGHGVGFRGNHRWWTANDTGNSYDSWFGEFPGIWCIDHGTWAMVADYGGSINGSGGLATTWGLYKPRPWSSAYKLIPAGQSPLPYDILGVARSSAAVTAGAYEVEDQPRGAFRVPRPPAVV